MSNDSNYSNSNSDEYQSQEFTPNLPSSSIDTNLASLHTPIEITKATTTSTTNKRPRNDTKNHTKKKEKKSYSYLDLYSPNLKYEPVYFTLEKYDDHDVIVPENNCSDSMKGALCLSQIRYHVSRDTHPQLPQLPQLHPGTPLCYYKSSYLVKVMVPILRVDQQEQCTSRMKVDHISGTDPIEKTGATTGTYDNDCTIELEMIIHQHVNGLCVICITSIHSILQQLIAYISGQQHDQQRQHTSTSIPNTEDGIDSNTTIKLPPSPTTTTIDDPIEWLITMSHAYHVQFQYHIQETPSSMSMADKRKRIMKTHVIGKSNSTNSSRNNHSNSIGLIQHSTETLASITITKKNDNQTTDVAPVSTTTNVVVPIKDNNTKTDDDIVYGIGIPCCVLGSIIELNDRYKSVSLNDDDTTSSHDQTISILQLLQIDPYRNGYLAIVQPSGSFPPFYPSKG